MVATLPIGITVENAQLIVAAVNRYAPPEKQNLSKPLPEAQPLSLTIDHPFNGRLEIVRPLEKGWLEVGIRERWTGHFSQEFVVHETQIKP